MIKEVLTHDLDVRNQYFLEKEVIKKRNSYLSEKDSESPAVAESLTSPSNGTKFNSLDRIRVVVESLISGESINSVCKKENINKLEYFQWVNDFHKAFNRYSEDYYKHSRVSTSIERQITEKSSNEVFKFYRKYLDDVYATQTLLLSENSEIPSSENVLGVNHIIAFKKVNDLGFINKYFEKVNKNLENQGYFMGCFETFADRNNKKKINQIPVIKNLSLGTDFLVHRVLPRLRYVNKAYFSITKGRNRSLSKAEALGRLVSCGFEIVDVKEIDGLHYFVSKKVKEPNYDMNASYGPIFKMQRVGKNGKMIGVYKFRTMHPYSEYLQDYVLKLNGYADNGKPANDFRVVPWGKFLRRYWLDELPQLINVVKGELKLVGIRPVSARYFQDIPEKIQKLRLTQKPGCIPPYVALNRANSVDSVLNAEEEYLIEKVNNPYFTDTRYFVKAIFNIVFKHKRSA